ncbi:unnamed protein product [Aphis gossypii]|uniref:Uncharacterized protein n=1 Tax=Aphis gossypii TaxID=80765 RepID=A0A9P0NJP7_APHGO|nr:unnamed protein product [Aphis gossypii]
MSELLMTPRVRAYIYINLNIISYQLHTAYTQSYLMSLPTYTYYIFICVRCVCRLHLAPPPSSPPPPPRLPGAAIIFCVSPSPRRQNRVAYYKSRALLIIAVYPIVNPALHRVATVNTYLYLPIYLPTYMAI